MENLIWGNTRLGLAPDLQEALRHIRNVGYIQQDALR